MSRDRWDDPRHDASRPARPGARDDGRGPLVYGAGSGRELPPDPRPRRPPRGAGGGGTAGSRRSGGQPRRPGAGDPASGRRRGTDDPAWGRRSRDEPGWDRRSTGDPGWDRRSTGDPAWDRRGVDRGRAGSVVRGESRRPVGGSDGRRGAPGGTGAGGADRRRGRGRPPWDGGATAPVGAVGGETRQVVVGDPLGARDAWSDRSGGGRGDRTRHVRGGAVAGDGGNGDGVDDVDAHRPRRSWPQRLVLCLGITLVVMCLLGASMAGYALVLHRRIDRVDNLDLPSAPAGEPENFLIVAVDTREGQGSRNTDTIMVVRVDPKSDRLALTSFPRDLIVTVADTGETGMINAVYNRTDGTGPRNLIDTLQQNYGITIHHFIEVNFESFKQVIDAVGGVTVWLDNPARDRASGFHALQAGCIPLDGESGLAFVRSRKLEVQIDGEWEHDPKSDESRVQRQQVFIQRAMAKAMSHVKSDPRRLHELVTIGVANVVLDPNLSLGDMRALAEHFQGFDAGNLEAYSLPVTPHPNDHNRLLLDGLPAEPILNVFRGAPPGEIGPPLIDVQVLNGTTADPAQEIENLATDASAALQHVGFKVGTPGDVPDRFYPQTTIQHAPGEDVYAQRVARHITSDHAIPVEANADLQPGHVVVIAGADFTTVHEQATPIDAMPAPAGAPAAGQAAAPTQGQADTTVATDAIAAPPTTVAERPQTPPTTANPFIIGSVPEERQGEC